MVKYNKITKNMFEQSLSTDFSNQWSFSPLAPSCTEMALHIEGLLILIIFYLAFSAAADGKIQEHTSEANSPISANRCSDVGSNLLPAVSGFKLQIWSCKASRGHSRQILSRFSHLVQLLIVMLG